MYGAVRKLFQIFREWLDLRAVKIYTIEPGGLFKGEDIGVDVQELTKSIENINAKILNYWLSKFVQEVVSKSGGRIPLGRLTVLSAA